MRTSGLQADTANDLEAASQERHAGKTPTRERTMTHKHNLDEFTPWKIESYELHDAQRTADRRRPDADRRRTIPTRT